MGSVPVIHQASDIAVLEDGVLNISLQKAKQGETWKGVFEEHILNEKFFEEDKKRLLLERFQTEVCLSVNLQT